MIHSFRNSAWALALILVWAVLPSIGHCSTSSITLEGSLMGPGAVPLTGMRAWSVTFFDSQSNGNMLGSPMSGATFVASNGRFSIALTPPAAVVGAASVWYALGVDTSETPDGTVDAADLFPARVELHAVPFAIKSASSDGLSSAATLGSSASATFLPDATTLKDPTGATRFAAYNATGAHAGESVLYAGATGTTRGIYMFANGPGTGSTAEFLPGGIANFKGSVTVTGKTSTDVLEVKGGADLAEMFAVHSSGTIEPGLCVSIDPDHPGELCVSNLAYDKKVAGVISGANGVGTGLVLHHEGTKADGNWPIALTGRVYCMADASAGAIEVGDMVTTSANPGHAMRATDRESREGAVIGKAMTALAGGEGMILVLLSSR